MKLLLAAAGIVLLAHAGGGTIPVHTYQVPSCHGIAAVPGYEKCKP